MEVAGRQDWEEEVLRELSEGCRARPVWKGDRVWSAERWVAGMVCIVSGQEVYDDDLGFVGRRQVCFSHEKHVFFKMGCEPRYINIADGITRGHDREIQVRGGTWMGRTALLPSITMSERWLLDQTYSRMSSWR